MNLVDRIAGWFAVPVLTRRRIWFAFAIALATDSAQFLLGPLGWVFVDEALDVVAMALTCAALGFHMLLLPTFIIKSIPVADMLPTWTGCTAAVVMLRKRGQAQPQPPPLPVSALGDAPERLPQPPLLPPERTPPALPPAPANPNAPAPSNALGNS